MQIKFQLLLLFALPFAAFAQREEKVISWQHLGWYHLEEQLKFGKNWQVVIEAEDRRFGFASSEHQYFGRGTIGYQFTDAYTVGAGFAYFGQQADSLTAFDDPLGTELRPHQQLTRESKSGRRQWTYRLRTEERFFRDVTSRRVTDKYDFNFRVRFLAQWNYTLNPNRPTGGGKSQLVLYDEVMVSGGAGVSHWFNQNRVYAGLSRQLGKTFTLEGGYLFIFQQRASGGRYWGRNVIRVALIHTWLIR